MIPPIMYIGSNSITKLYHAHHIKHEVRMLYSIYEKNSSTFYILYDSFFVNFFNFILLQYTRQYGAHELFYGTYFPRIWNF